MSRRCVACGDGSKHSTAFCRLCKKSWDETFGDDGNGATMDVVLWTAKRVRWGQTRRQAKAWREHDAYVAKVLK